MSRTPVREALGRLAAEGLVEIVPNRGARVTSWTVAELEGVFDLRAALEPRLTALAVPPRGADVAALDELAGHVRRRHARPGQDLDAIVPLNREFHGRLVALADQPAWRARWRAPIHAPIVLRNFHTYDEASLRRSLAHHVEIVAAVRAGDPAWAQAVMTAHIRNARAVMVRAAARHSPREET